MNETSAILRYLGKQHGYYPADPMEAWQVDAIADFLTDYMIKYGPNQMMKKDFSDAAFTDFTNNWTHIVAFLGKQLKHGKPFLTGDKITTADFSAV